jgi:tetratricopeptide (TPR) repeat protein
MATWWSPRRSRNRTPSDVDDASREHIHQLLDSAKSADERWEQYRDLDALRHAARAWVELGELVPKLLAGAMNEGAGRLLQCYEQTDDEADLIAARDLMIRSVAATPVDDQERSLRLGNLGCAWRSTYERSEDPDDLQRALGAFEEAVATVPATAEHRPAALAGLAAALRAIYQRDGDLAALDRAVALDEQALAGLPPDADARIACLNGLANSLSLRNARRQDRRDVERLVAAREEALALARPGTPQHLMMLNNVANAYEERFEATGDPADLDRAISMSERAVAARGPRSPGYTGTLRNLGSKLRARYNRVGDVAALERSIDLLGEALDRCIPGGPEWQAVAHDLASDLRERFSRLGTFDDLERTISILEQVVAGTVATSPEASGRHETLGNALRARYLRNHREEDLAGAIATYEQALELVPSDSAASARLLNNLGSAVNDRYDRGADEADLRRAKDCYTEAYRLAPPGMGEWRRARNNLGRVLMTEARRTGSVDASKAAVAAFVEALHHTPDQTPEKLIHLLNLAGAQIAVHRTTGEEDARQQALATLQTIAAMSLTVAPDQGLKATRLWGNWATDRGDWAEAAEAYRAGLACLDLLYRRQGRRDQKEVWLGDAVGIAPGAAHALARTGDIETAVVVAEAGRAVLLSEALDRVSADLDTLVRAGHEPLASEYRHLVDALAAADRVPDDPIAAAREASPPRPSAADLRDAVDAVVARIRAVPGFEDFQRPPTFPAVAAAAGPAPVVYLVPSRRGGVALVVSARGPAAVWLPDLTTDALAWRLGPYLRAYDAQRADPVGWRSALLDLTRWLWPVLMEPVVGALAGEEQAVLVPMGQLGMLPLHVAWRPDPTAPTGRRYALDDLVLTYAPNARAVAHARRVPAVTAADGILVVADPQPVRAESLRYAVSEADAALGMFAQKHRLAGPDATRSAVLIEMSRWPVLHFACHAYADSRKPLDSALLLAHEERVSLADLMRADAFHPGLVILSACETAVIGGEVPDEVVSLPSGFLQSGARGVLGSLWPVYDSSTALLMHRFYQIWRGDDRTPPAVALRAAQQWLRDTPAAVAWANLGRRGAVRDLAVDAAELDDGHGGSAGHGHPVHWAAFAYVGG